MDKNIAQDIIKKLTSYSKYYGVVNIDGYQQGVTRFANSQISQNVNQSDVSVSLTLYDGKKEATCTSNVLDEEALKQLARDTEDLLAVAPPGDLEYTPNKIEEVPEIENDKDIALKYNAKGRAEAIKEGVANLAPDLTAAGALILEKKIAAYGNNESILFADLDNVQFNTVVSLAESNSDGGAECLSHKVEELDIPAAFAQAQRRAVLGANPNPLEGGEYTVVLSPQAVGDLVFYLTWSLNAKRIADGLSFYTDKSLTFGKNINIYDDVNNPQVYPWYFDYEGNKRQVLPLIEQGEVKNILCDAKTGKVTGHALSNKGNGGYSLHTVMTGEDVLQGQDDMISNIKRGLFISELHYTNFVNPQKLIVTGLTRNGTFLIEDGKFSKAVSTMRFTQNLLQAFNSVSAISQETAIVNSFGGWAAVMPYAVIEGFSFP